MPSAWSIMNQFQFTITIPNDRGDLIGPEGILLDPNFVQIGFLEIVNCNNGPPSKDPAAVAKNSRKRLILCFYDFFMLTWYVLISIFEF